MSNLFQNVRTLEELKKLYKKYAIKFHPDNGGSEEQMKALNTAYDEAFSRVKDTHYNEEKGEYYTRHTNETANFYRDMINELLNYNGVDIEIIGAWIWLSGNTYPYKEQIKSLGFTWSKARKMWWFGEVQNFHPRKAKRLDMDTIRSRYGSEQITGTASRPQLA